MKMYYGIRLLDGPLAGTSLDWEWNDNEAGHAGEEAGLIVMSTDRPDHPNLAYQCNEDKTEAQHVEMVCFELIGGPLDGAQVSALPCNLARLSNLPDTSELKFGGMLYILDRKAGTATFQSGRDEQGLLNQW
jgi:hypothetical protein